MPILNPAFVWMPLAWSAQVSSGSCNVAPPGASPSLRFYAPLRLLCSHTDLFTSRAQEGCIVETEALSDQGFGHFC